LSYAFAPIQSANAQAIKALGRSDIYLKLEAFKKILGLALLVLSMPFGPFAIAASAVFSNVVGALINIFPNIKLLNYKASEQIRDYTNGFLPLVLMMAIVFLIGKLNMADIWLLLLQVSVGAVVYIAFSCVFRIKSFYYVINTLLKKKG
jgi:O-antigen/teichoic acid export membrane protein